MKQQTAKLLKVLSTILVIFAVIIAFLISGMRIFGFQVYGVLTGSMEPAYPTGSLIYVKDVDARTLRVNDVITFSVSPNVVATHRIVELVPDSTNPAVTLYRTKGDANNEVDATLVAERNIIGKVSFCVPFLGNMANYIQNPPGTYVAIVVCLLMIGFVVYTDSITNDKKQPASAKATVSLTDQINRIAVKILKKPLINKKAPIANTTVKQGFVPQPNSQQHPNFQQNPQYTQQMPQNYQYPQQPYGYAQNMNYDPQQAPQNYQYPQQQPYGYAPQYPQQNAQYNAQQMPQNYQYPQQQPYGYAPQYPQQNMQYNPQQFPQNYQYPQQQPYGYAPQHPQNTQQTGYPMPEQQPQQPQQ